MSDPGRAAGNGFWAAATSERSLDRYATLVDALGEGVFQLDAEGEFVAVDEATVEMTGYSPDELVGEPVSLLLADDAERIEREIQRRFAADEPDGEAFEVTARTPDGAELVCELQTNPIVEDGDLRGSIGILRDVTDHNRTERHLRERERQLQRERDLTDRVLETSPVGILVLDGEGDVTRINERGKELLEVDDVEGYEPSDRPTYDEDGDPVPVEEHPFARALATGEPVYDELLQVELPDGEQRWLSVNATPILDEDGAIDRVVTTGEDVTSLKKREQELQRHRDELAAELEEIYGRITDAFYALDEAFRFTHLNDRAEEILGVDEEEVLGTEVWEVFPAGASTAFEDRYREALRTQEPVSFEEYHPPDDAWYQEHVYPSETGLSVYFRDVTERHEMEAKLREQEERFRQFAEHIEEVFWMTPPEKSEMTYVSPAYEEIWGRSRESLYEEPSSFLDGIHPEDRDRVRDALDRQADGEYDEEYRVVRPDGTVRWVRDRAFPIEDEDGEVYRIVGVAVDVTDRKEVEQELREREATFRMVAENLDEIVWMTNSDAGEFRYVNPAYEEVFGQDREALYEEPDAFEERLHPADRDRVLEAWDGLPDEPFEEEYRVVRPDGETRWVHARATRIHDESGDVTRVVGFTNDVTERVERERALERSERRYRTLVENFPNGAVALFDENLKYTAVGGEYFEEAGVDLDERIGNQVYDIYPEEIVERVKPNFEAALDGEESKFRVEFYDRHLDVHVVPVRNADGEVDAGMAVAQDVTGRVERERELERTLDLLNETEQIADVAGWEVDPETEAPYWSDRLFELLDVDYDRQPTLEEALDVYHTDDDRAVVEDAVEEALETGEPFDVEARFPRPDGDVGWLRVKGAPQVEDGEVASLRGAVQDVTERKEREQALQESRNQLRALIDVLPVAVFVAEADGEIVEWNDAAEEIWGGEVAESDSVAEYDAYEAWWADSGEPVEPDEWPLARALEGEEVTDPDEIRIKGFDGEYRTVLNHGMPVRDETGEVTRAVVTLIDITERKEYQRKLEASNERLEQFAYAASHDLQEPLRMVSSYLQLLERRYADELDEDAEEFIEFAVDGADRMEAMIEGLLEYSRVDTRGDPLEPTDLDAVLADVREDLRLQIEETDAEIDVDPLPVVQGDASQLRQVFQNLLENAIEYAGDEPPAIDVTAERRAGEWAVSVTDEGIGIDPDDQERVFEVFQRLHTHDEYEGTGIGLALCKRIVERHGGDIRVDSDPGEGTTFTITLPAVDGHDRDHD